MKGPDLVLLSTAHCSLCEQALDLLLSMPELRGRSLEVVDVAAHEVLMERYGPRLPVLALAAGAGRRPSCRELDWPFSREDVSALLNV